MSLKTQASALRDHIYRIEKEEELKGEAKSRGNRFSNPNSNTGSIGADSLASSNQPSFHTSKASRKHREKLAVIEADIVLAAPQLLFQVRMYKIHEFRKQEHIMVVFKFEFDSSSFFIISITLCDT